MSTGRSRREPSGRFRRLLRARWFDASAARNECPADTSAPSGANASARGGTRQAGPVRPDNLPDLDLDPHQRAAADRLAKLLDHQGNPIPRARGVYLHGRPGRGKTMLMDRLPSTAHPDRVRRFHFHTFFAELHRAHREHGSIDKAITHLIGRTNLLCFDEFHVHDVGDAMLLARLLDALFARHVTLVLTSNYPPPDLLPNPLFHEKFLPAIDRILDNLDVLSVDGPIDYRTRKAHTTTGFASGRYIVDRREPADPPDTRITPTRHAGIPSSRMPDATATPSSRAENLRLASSRVTHTIQDQSPPPMPPPPSDSIRTLSTHNEADHGTTPDPTPTHTHPSVNIPLGPRTLTARSTTETSIDFDFTQLCAQPTSAADYVTLTHRYHRWTLRDVPLLRDVPPDHAMRLVNLIDVLYDADIPLTIHTAAPPAELVAGVRGVPDLARTASRLCEISQDHAAGVCS
ncbi:AFG1-like ATPase [Nocardia puris]|uniref:AFG1-like ATPase n=1 Tax=Nocardia puris TaxID=208602 RepID=A0A366DDV1_9NOCA|nr:AFG1-like ATPase [Nocardia puris]